MIINNIYNHIYIIKKRLSRKISGRRKMIFKHDDLFGLQIIILNIIKELCLLFPGCMQKKLRIESNFDIL